MINILIFEHKCNFQKTRFCEKNKKQFRTKRFHNSKTQKNSANLSLSSLITIRMLIASRKTKGNPNFRGLEKTTTKLKI